MSHISSSRQDGLATYGHFHQQLAHEAAADHLRRAAVSSQGQAGVEELAAGSEARISAFVHWALRERLRRHLGQDNTLAQHA